MARAPRQLLVAGILPAELKLPGGLLVRPRKVGITHEGIRHIAQRRPDQLVFCLLHMGEVLAGREYIGLRPTVDPRRVEFVRRVGGNERHLLVAVKFLEFNKEAWVTTAHLMKPDYLTRRLRAGTMHVVGRGP